jgi:phosphatidylglycerol:prolipoprotein diacylglycerol transferase
VRTLASFSSEEFPAAVRFPHASQIFRQHEKLGLVGSGEPHSLPVHPVQLYEAALVGGLCVYLVRANRKRAFQGEIICKLLIGYGCIRFLLEFLRADNPPIYLGLTLSQVISSALAGIGVLLLCVARFSAQRAALMTRDACAEKPVAA